MKLKKTKDKKSYKIKRYPIEKEEKKKFINTKENIYFTFDSDSISEENIDSNQENNACLGKIIFK